MRSAHTIDELRTAVRSFVDEREWDRFHSPKDLAVGLAVEAGELLENFQWKDPGRDELRADPDAADRIRDEVADVVIYALLLSDALGVNLAEAVMAKLEKNARKYPVERARGKAAKYSEL